MAARVDPEMQALLNGDPQRTLDAIIMARGRLDELLECLPDDVTIVHQYRLIGSVSVSATAGALRGLVWLRAVKSIEPVRDVSHC